MSKSKSKPLMKHGFDWRKTKDDSSLEGERERKSPLLPIPVTQSYYTHHDPSLKPRKRISQAFAHHRLCERLR